MQEFKVAFMAHHDGIRLRDIAMTIRAESMKDAEEYAETFMQMAFGTVALGKVGYDKYFVIMTDSAPTP